MKKIFFNLISIILLVFSLLTTTVLDKTNYSNFNSSMSNNSRIKNPSFPGFQTMTTHQKEVAYKKNDTTGWSKKTAISNFNWKEKADTWEEFILQYPTFIVDLNTDESYVWSYQNKQSGSGQTTINLQNRTFNTEDIKEKIDIPELNKDTANNPIWWETQTTKKEKTGWSSGHVAYYIYKDGDYIYFYSAVSAGAEYSLIITYSSQSQLQLNNLTFNTSYKLDQFKKEVIKKGEKPILYTSYTGASIDSEEKTLASDSPGAPPSGVSNKDAITKILMERAPNTFSNEWQDYFNFGMRYNLYNWDTVKNTVDTVFTLNNQEFLKYTTPIKLTIDQSYWDMSFLKRLEIRPGKVVDLNDLSKTTVDIPELINNEGDQTFIFHNAVNVSFSANKNEKLLINNKETEVWNDIFIATLTDGRNENSSIIEGNNKYVISVEVDGEESFKRTIEINSLNPIVDFQWMGWDPQPDSGDKNKYDQWVLTQEYLNGQENPLYDPYIDPKTGTRTQTIFVNERPLNDPFLIDPKDRYGQTIDSPENDDIQRWGYLAEAYVVNKGIKYLFDKQTALQFADIERVEIDPKTFEEIGERQAIDVTKDVQFSKPGTWHYIFYLKDHVSQEMWGDNTIYNPPINKSIEATKGTTIHKIITLDSEQESYRRFLDLEDSKKNSNIHEWFTTSPGGHLRMFMVSNNLINNETILETIKYEELVNYWRQYVSAAINGHMTYDPELDERIDLNQEPPIYFPMRATNVEDARNTITRKIKKEMFKFGGSSFEKDYVIESSEGHIPFEQIDLTKFSSISNSNPLEELDLKVIPTASSLILKENTSVAIQINNNINYDEDLLINLSDVRINSFNANFTNASEEVKENFFNNYLLAYVSESLDLYRVSKNETLKQIPEVDEDGNATGNLVDKEIPEYQYGKDYAIYIDGMKLDITQEPTIQDYINLFLNSSKKQTMWVRTNAVRGTLLLSGGTMYQITNDPKSNVKPPVKPDPTKPDPGDKPGVDENESHFQGIWFLVLIPIVLIGVFTSVITIKRRKRLKGYKLK